MIVLSTQCGISVVPMFIFFIQVHLNFSSLHLQKEIVVIGTWYGTPVTGTRNIGSIYNEQDHCRVRTLTKCIQVSTSIDIGVPSSVPSRDPLRVLGESSKYNQVLISPLSCQHFLYLPIMKDGGCVVF